MKQAAEIINDPDLYRENANINQHIVAPLSMMDAINDVIHIWGEQLNTTDGWTRYTEPWEPPPTPMDKLLPSFSNWSRAEAMKGSEQSVRAALGQAQNEGLGQAPNLTPNPRPNQPSTMAVVAYNGVKQLNKDIRRKRWL